MTRRPDARRPSPTGTSDLERLEDELRVALARRAAAFHPEPPGSAARPPLRLLPPRPRWRPLLVARVAAVVVPVLLLAGAVGLLRARDDDGDPGTGDAAARGQELASPTDHAVPVPRLLVTLPRTYAVYADERVEPDAPEVVASAHLQSFRVPGRLEGPMAFVATWPPDDPDAPTAWRVDSRRGPRTRDVVLRGRAGTLARPEGDGGPVAATVELDDGSTLAVQAIGLTDDEVVAFVDGLVRSGGSGDSGDGSDGSDGRWRATVTPGGIAEVDAEEPAADGTAWEIAYGGEGADVDVHLYAVGFEWRLAGRVAASVAPVEQIAVDGVPAALGRYAANDWWVLLEPVPGRAVELRITGDRAEVDRVLDATRFVDEATFAEALPG